MKKFNTPSGKPPTVDPDAIARQLRINWLRTIFGILLMGGLSAGVLYMFGMHWTLATVILLLFSVVMPVFGWYNSGNLVLKLMKCKEPNMDNPDHARLVRLVDELYPLTGLAKKPAVYVSPIPVPNAFATGRNPANAFIAATEGLFMVDLEDREIKAILAHELAHVKSRDVAITSLVSVLGSLFAIALAGVFPNWFRACFSETNSRGTSMLDKLTDKVRRDKKRFADPVTGVTGFFLTILVFYIVSFLAKFVTFFVSRSRESAADVLAAQWTKDPCALATALQKIVDWMNRNKAILQMRILLEGMEPLLFVSLHEGEEGLEPKKPKGFFEKLRHRMRHLGDNHPPVEDRIVMLGVLAGDACPRLSDIKRKKQEDFERLIKMRRRAFEEEFGEPKAAPKGDKAEGKGDKGNGTGDNSAPKSE